MPSDLNETYAELCKLIGAEHPRLSYYDGELACWALNRDPIAAADAQALIDQWAGDRLLSAKPRVTIEIRRGLLGVPAWYRIVTYDDVLLAEGDNLAEAVLSALKA